MLQLLFKYIEFVVSIAPDGSKIFFEFDFHIPTCLDYCQFLHYIAAYLTLKLYFLVLFANLKSKTSKRDFMSFLKIVYLFLHLL